MWLFKKKTSNQDSFNNIERDIIITLFSIKKDSKSLDIYNIADSIISEICNQGVSATTIKTDQDILNDLKHIKEKEKTSLKNIF